MIELSETKVKSLVSQLDAFPKIDTFCLERTRRGGLASIVCYTIILALILAQTLRYFFASTEQSFIVDPTIDQFVHFHMDFSVASRCNALLVFLQEPDGTRRDISQHFTGQVEDLSWMDHPSDPSTANVNSSLFTGCRLKGSLEISRTKGIISVMPILSTVGGQMGQLVTALDDSINFSHRIHDVSFGTGRSGAQFFNRQSKQSIGAHQIYTYFLSVINHYYSSSSSLVNVSRSNLSPKGCSATVNGFQGSPSLHPALTFHYDFEPLATIQRPHSITFIQFLIHLVGILGGVYTCSNLISSGIGFLEQLVFQKPSQSSRIARQRIPTREAYQNLDRNIPMSPSQVL